MEQDTMLGQPAERKTRATLPYLWLMLAALFWAGNFVIGRAIRGDMPPVVLNFGRWLIALLILLPFSYGQVRRHWPVIRAEWKMVVILGITGVAAFNSLVYTALETTQAINAVLFTSTVPLFIGLIAWLMFRDTLTGRQIAGILLSLLGVVTVVARGDFARLLNLSFNPGDLWMLVAVPVWAYYSVLLKRRPAELPQLPLLTATVVVGVIALLPVIIWQFVQGATVSLNSTNILALLYIGLFASVLAFICWNSGVAALGPNKAGTFIHLMPVFGAILSVIFLGEQIAAYHLLGATLVFSGIALTSWQSMRR